MQVTRFKKASSSSLLLLLLIPSSSMCFWRVLLSCFFEGSGVFLLGAVLDRFFAEYAAINHFTTTVIQTQERGVIARWPARSGSRREL